MIAGVTGSDARGGGRTGVQDQDLAISSMRGEDTHPMRAAVRGCPLRTICDNPRKTMPSPPTSHRERPGRQGRPRDPRRQGRWARRRLTRVPEGRRHRRSASAVERSSAHWAFSQWWLIGMVISSYVTGVGSEVEREAHCPGAGRAAVHDRPCVRPSPGPVAMQPHRADRQHNEACDRADHTYAEADPCEPRGV